MQRLPHKGLVLAGAAAVGVLLGCVRCTAADGAGAKADAGKPPTVENHSDSNAVRLSVLNAIANYVNKSWEASIRIQWDFLPDTPVLDALSAGVKPVEIEIANGELETGAWAGHVTDPTRLQALTGALGVKTLKEFLATDRPLPTDYEQSLQNSAVLTSDEQIAAKVDHYALRAILRSAGIRFKVKLPPDVVVQGGNERTFDGEIVWRIVLYPQTRGEPKFTFYRAQVRAELRRPQTFTFPMSSSGKKPIKVIAALKQSANTLALPLEVSAGDGAVNIPDPPADPAVNLPSTHSSTTIEGVLDFVGGVSLDEVVAKQLFNPRNPARLFYGGLIGQGAIKQLVGVNQLFSTVSRAAAVGLLMGIAPARDNALFIGPSLQTDALTLSVGAMALDRDNGPNAKRTIKVEPAVTLSLDLSNLVGGAKNVQTIPLANNVIGGISGDDVARQNYAVTTRVEPAASLSPDDKKAVLGKAILLRRVASYDEHGLRVDLPKEKQTVFYASVSTQPLYRIVPRGSYQVERGDLPMEFGAFFAGETAPAQRIEVGQPNSQASFTIRLSIKRLAGQ